MVRAIWEEKVFFVGPIFLYPPPLGGVTPEKKYPTRYQNFFLPPPPVNVPPLGDPG